MISSEKNWLPQLSIFPRNSSAGIWDFRWIPFGTFQSWGFDLHVKSGRLAEFLRFQQPRAERRRGFGRGRPSSF